MSIQVICGAPGSGKTTHVAQHAQSGDLIIDVDALYHALTGLAWYDKPQSLLKYVLAARDGILNKLARSPDVNAWIVAEAPRRAERNRLRDRFDAQVTVMEIPTADCLLRISADDRRKGHLEEWMPRVQSWWQRYEKDERDTVIGLPTSLNETATKADVP